MVGGWSGVVKFLMFRMCGSPLCATRTLGTIGFQLCGLRECVRENQPEKWGWLFCNQKLPNFTDHILTVAAMYVQELQLSTEYKSFLEAFIPNSVAA